MDDSIRDLEESTTCPRCEQRRPREDFHKGKSACKPCRRVERRKRPFQSADYVPALPEGLILCRICETALPIDSFSPSRLAKRDCKRCAAKINAAWKAANPEAVAAIKRRTNRKYAAAYSERRKRYYAANREAENAWFKRYYDENRERLIAQSRAWMESNPDATAEGHRRKRAKRAGARRGPIDLAALWTGSCGICGGPLDRDLRWPDPMSKSVDHIIPLARGGSHTQDNLRWSHLLCNVRKGARLPDAA